MAATHSDHLVNFEAIKMAERSLSKLGASAEFWPPIGYPKQAFVPAGGGDPAAGGGQGPPPGGGGAPPPGGDPSGGMGGGMGGPPPGGPPPGGDPSGGGGGGGGDLMSQLMPAIQQAVQQAMAGAGGGAGGAPGAAGGLKPKIDVNVEIMQMKNLMAKIVDHLGIPVPAQDMTATPDKLMAMSQGQSTASPAPGGGDPSGGGAIGGMQPMQPMQGAGTPGMAQKTGEYGGGSPFDGNVFMSTANIAAALLTRRALRAAA